MANNIQDTILNGSVLNQIVYQNPTKPPVKELPGCPKSFKSFTGREKELEFLNTTLKAKQNAKDLEDRIIVIVGLSGMGKSCLARKYAEKFKQDHSNFVWINAQTYHTLLSSFMYLASNLDLKIYDDLQEDWKKNKLDKIQIEHLVNQVYRHFSNEIKHGVFIFDNANQMSSNDDSPSLESSVGVNEFLPQNEYQNLPLFLIASIYDNWGKVLVYRLLTLSPQESQTFLCQQVDLQNLFGLDPDPEPEDPLPDDMIPMEPEVNHHERAVRAAGVTLKNFVIGTAVVVVASLIPFPPVYWWARRTLNGLQRRAEVQIEEPRAGVRRRPTLKETRQNVRNSMNEVNDLLGGFPLAIALAAANINSELKKDSSSPEIVYLNAVNCEVKGFKEEFIKQEQKWSEIKFSDSDLEKRPCNKIMSTVLSATMDKIKQKEGVNRFQTSHEILSSLAYLPSNQIYLKWCVVHHDVKAPKSFEYLGYYEDDMEFNYGLHKTPIGETIHTLKKFCLVDELEKIASQSPDFEETFSIHGLIQKLIRIRLKHEKKDLSSLLFVAESVKNDFLTTNYLSLRDYPRCILEHLTTTIVSYRELGNSSKVVEVVNKLATLAPLLTHPHFGCRVEDWKVKLFQFISQKVDSKVRRLEFYGCEILDFYYHLINCKTVCPGKVMPLDGNLDNSIVSSRFVDKWRIRDYDDFLYTILNKALEYKMSCLVQEGTVEILNLMIEKFGVIIADVSLDDKIYLWTHGYERPHANLIQLWVHRYLSTDKVVYKKFDSRRCGQRKSCLMHPHIFR